MTEQTNIALVRSIGGDGKQMISFVSPDLMVTGGAEDAQLVAMLQQALLDGQVSLSTPSLVAAHHDDQIKSMAQTMASAKQESYNEGFVEGTRFETGYMNRKMNEARKESFAAGYDAAKDEMVRVIDGQLQKQRKGRSVGTYVLAGLSAGDLELVKTFIRTFVSLPPVLREKAGFATGGSLGGATNHVVGAKPTESITINVSAKDAAEAFAFAAGAAKHNPTGRVTAEQVLEIAAKQAKRDKNDQDMAKLAGEAGANADSSTRSYFEDRARGRNDIARSYFDAALRSRVESSDFRHGLAEARHKSDY